MITAIVSREQINHCCIGLGDTTPATTARPTSSQQFRDGPLVWQTMGPLIWQTMGSCTSMPSYD
jgi:hypothetical protein